MSMANLEVPPCLRFGQDHEVFQLQEIVEFLFLGRGQESFVVAGSQIRNPRLHGFGRPELDQALRSDSGGEEIDQLQVCWRGFIHRSFIIA